MVTIENIFRQDGEDLEQKNFRQLLSNLRDANPTIVDWNLLMLQIRSNIIPNISDDFDKNLHLFSTNDNVRIHNRSMLHSLGEPVARIIATKVSNVTGVDEISTDELDMEFLISKHARVMLTSNLWIEVGLVNGVVGFVHEIVYKPGTMPPELPLYVMVKFDTFYGLPFTEENPKIVPIYPIQRGSTNQIPLRLAWVLTIHKSQGLTLEKETIDIG